MMIFTIFFVVLDEDALIISVSDSVFVQYDFEASVEKCVELIMSKFGLLVDNCNNQKYRDQYF